MTIKNRAIRIYLTVLAFATLAASGIRAAALVKDFDFASGHFDGKSLITAASLLTVASAIVMITYVFFADKSKGYVAQFSTPLTYVPAGAVCAATVFFLLNIKEAIPKLSEVSKGTPITDILLLLVFYLAFPTVIYFILNSVSSERASNARAVCGIATVICFALYTSYLYFDTALTINNPNKIIDEMAFLLAALFFLYETRISISRESWNLYFVTGAIASSVGLYSSVPAIIATMIRDKAISESLEENVLILTVAVFIFARLILSATYNEDKRSDTITMLRDAALEREAFICEREEIERQTALASSEEETVIDESLFIDAPEVKAEETEATESEATESEATESELVAETEPEATETAEVEESLEDVVEIVSDPDATEEDTTEAEDVTSEDTASLEITTADAEPEINSADEENTPVAQTLEEDI